MDERRVKKIVNKVFAKARKQSLNHTKNALCNHVEVECGVSGRTLDRLFLKYEKKEKIDYIPIENTVDELCRYLGYLSYADYLGKTKMGEGFRIGGKTWKMLIGTSLILIVVVLVYYQFFDQRCMTWTGNEYVKVACSSSQSYEVVPLDRFRLQRMKKLEVDAATPFFNEETEEPLIWYYKVDDNTLEYFTDAGKHPVNGETLKAITPYIIEKYVPKHIYKSGSFIK